MMEEQNVKFYMKDGVAEITGEDGKVALLYCFCIGLFNIRHFDVIFKCPSRSRSQDAQYQDPETEAA